MQIGEKAPDFTLPRDGGGEITLSELRPKKVVLYFYPRDDTPGCTLEAIEFTAEAAAFAVDGATILGISRDPVAAHDKFVKKHSLGIALLSDADSDVCERYGVWVEKKMYGRSSMGIERTTVLIDGDGLIAKVWHKVKVDGHVKDVLQAVREL